jgi:hypothetical protein
MKFDTDEEAIQLANDSKFGLGCAVFSGSKERANAIAAKIKTGFAAINDFAVTYMCQVKVSNTIFIKHVLLKFCKILLKLALHHTARGWAKNMNSILPFVQPLDTSIFRVESYEICKNDISLCKYARMPLEVQVIASHEL